ncbi:MAG: C-GCAxxG-C-C family protein [Alphaproteobacteria bacterium]|jgi:C_GCAxxG_C_C family probable redox protein|nr:C-GCAxxG-C-C family protein [Alphaproteobacteria bacterium]MDP6564482.1 C-GCAxxG-C-C family protein [Alphaproteobacteria bacterium]MDP6814693.1 C-GCAxxG-C-C family protein [Alphaproteobacteria bacterium]
MRDAEARGRELFDGGFYCAEAVLKTIAERQGIDSALIPGIATGFCGGMARSGGPCGAVTGAVMALGVAYGRDDPGRPVKQTYDAVRAMMAEFEARFGSSNCTDLLGVDLNTPEGRQAFDEQNLDRKCTDFTGAAAALVAAALEEPGA